MIEDSDDDADAERRHHNEVVASMRHYYVFFRKTMIKRMEKHHATLTESQLALMPGGRSGIKAKIASYDMCLRANQMFFDKVLLHMGEAPSALTTDFDPEGVQTPEIKLGSWQVPHHHASKLSGTLHAVSRDWTQDGAGEREESYEPLLKVVKEKLPLGSNILVPGSGLARLTCEITAAGFKAEGNDFDLFMLFTARYLLNGLPNESEQCSIHPWIHALCNNLSHADALREVKVPDRSAADILDASTSEQRDAGEMSMSAGEFILVYEPIVAQYDAFVSCFFIDTAPNILDYIQLVYKLLAPGGLWVNIGPLMYHWADQFSSLSSEGQIDDRYHQSLELSWEEVKHAMMTMGFVIESEETDLPCHYTLNERSLMRTQYRCLSFTARKPSA